MMEDTEEAGGRPGRVEQPGVPGQGGVGQGSPGGRLGEQQPLAAVLQLLLEQPPEQRGGDVVEGVSQQVVVGDHAAV